MGAALSTMNSSSLRERSNRRLTARRLLRGAARWKTFTLGLTLITMFAIGAIFAGQIAAYDPAKPDFKALKQSPSTNHLFGTDDKGRDIFSRVVYGTRVSFAIAIVSVTLATAIGL